MLPSLPGYGFSGEPSEVGWNVGRVAQAWAELMHRLGYTRYVAQGGDVGAAVTDAMGRQAPEGLLGIHMNLLVTVLGGPQPTESEQERAAADQLATFRESGFGYFLEMATRPQTIGYALLDSPVALAAWLLDHDTDSYYKISRAFVDGEPVGQSHPGPHRRQHHAVLADGHRRLGGPVLLGGRTSPGSSTRVRPGSSGGLAPGRLHHLPRRDLADPAQLGRELLPERHLLQRGRQGRPLRRLGRAGAVRHRGPRGVPVAALIGTQERRARKSARRLRPSTPREERTWLRQHRPTGLHSRPRPRCVRERLELERGDRAAAGRRRADHGTCDPLRGIAADSAYIAAVLEQIEGPVVAVGHPTAAQ